MNPTPCDTRFFRGIEISKCPVSGIKWPSKISLSFCCASLRNTSPRCFFSCPYNVFRRHFGINTTWYLHSHLLWLRLSNSSILDLLFVCLAAHDSEFPRWTPVSVKLLLPPRQSRGVSRCRLVRSPRAFPAHRWPPSRSASDQAC